MSKDAKKKNNEKQRHFLKDVKAELKKVIWPTPKQLVNNTLAVIAIVIVVGVIVFALDVCFEKLNSLGVEKLKAVVETTKNEENTTENSEASTDKNADNSENVAEKSEEPSSEEQTDAQKEATPEE
mgnify:CR=1 FL=1